MTDPDPIEILRATTSVLLIDYPGRIVPDTLARAGFDVVAHEGPGPLEYRHYRVGDDGEIVRSDGGPAPDHADLVFEYRPIDELPPIIDEAKRIGATAVWIHDDGTNADEVAESRRLVREAGLPAVTEPFILDAVSSLRPPTP